MSTFDGDSSNRIVFILAGQPELVATLLFSHFDALRARIRLSHTLTPMSPEETIKYIDHGCFVQPHIPLRLRNFPRLPDGSSA